jgi:hypothetical protein
MASSQSLKRFVDWEEQFVSHDRGSRVVHYYLKDRHGHSSLAVIGNERSLRHMVYVVCDDFLPHTGLDKSTTPAFKWRARREVVDWLQSLLFKTPQPPPLPPPPPPPSCDPYRSSGSPNQEAGESSEIDLDMENADPRESTPEEKIGNHHV